MNGFAEADRGDLLLKEEREENKEVVENEKRGL